MTYSIFRKAMLRSAAISMMVLAPVIVSLPSAAQAQTAATSRIVTLTFTGTVTSDPAATIEIRQADGTYTPYTGLLPANSAYKAGDEVTITMNATLPTQAYIQNLTASGTPVPADGIYHFKLSSDMNGNGSNSQVVGNVTPAVISGGLRSVGAFGEPNYTTISIVYDANTDTYALDGSGSFYDKNVLGAGFTYDPATATVSACSGTSCAPQQVTYGAYSLAGDSDGSITSTFSYIRDTAGDILGRFTLGLTGSWSLPTYNSGGATQVPEPGMLMLLGAGAIVPVLRRRRAIKTGSKSAR